MNNNRFKAWIIKASLRFRAALASAITLLVFLTLAWFGLQIAYTESLDNAAEGELKAYMLSLLGQIDVGESGDIEVFDLSIAAFKQPNSGIYAEIWRNDELQWRSESLVGEPLRKTVVDKASVYLLSSALSHKRSINQSNGQQKKREYNQLSLLVDWEEEEVVQQFKIVVANDAEPYIARQASFNNRLKFWLVLAGFTLLLMQLALFHWLFKPVSKVSNELSLIQSGLKQEFSDEYPKEVVTLTDSLNVFLGNERLHIKKVRESLANLAHSLKTPLASIRSEFTGEKIDEKAIFENIDRMGQVIDYQLNKTSSSVRPSYRQSNKCFGQIERIVNVLQKLHKPQGINLYLNVNDQEGLVFKGDLDDLSEIVGNIVENACKWAKSKVLVQAENINDQLHLLIVDDGPGIPSDKFDSVLIRGQRIDSKTEGHGIGLSMVADLVESYSGTIEFAESSAYKAGFKNVFKSELKSEFKSGLAVSIKV